MKIYNKRFIAGILSLCMVLLPAFPVYAENYAGLRTIEGKTYYFNGEGIPQTGWQTIGGIDYYFLPENGQRCEGMTKVIDGAEYTFGETGIVSRVGQENDLQTEEEKLPEAEQQPESDQPLEGENLPENDQPLDGENLPENDQPLDGENLPENSQTMDDEDLSENNQPSKGEQLPENEDLPELEEPSEKADSAESKKPLVNTTNIKIMTGFQTINGKLYFFNDLGELQHGWINVGDKKYFAAADGVLYQDQFISFGSTTIYYMGSDGSVQKGVIKTKSGECYNADKSSGIIRKQAGWIEENGKRYFSDLNGRLYQNQFISFGSSTMYYMGSDGSVQKGIIRTADGAMYNADKSSGQIRKQAGWLEENGKRYFSDLNGKLYQNQFISFGSTTMYYMGSDGSIQKGFVRTVDGAIYNADKVSGQIKKQAGWLEENGKKYFSDANGKLYSNQFISFGSTYYYCGSDAAIIRGQKDYPAGGVLYSFDADGIMKKEGGWGEYNGNKYYKNPATGFPYKNQWVTFGSSVRYYSDASGLMVSGWRSVGGYRYYFYPDTKKLAMNTIADGIQVRSDGKVVGTANTNTRLNWLFPNGLPGTETQMKSYLTTIVVPVVDINGNPSTMTLTIHKKLVHEITAVFNELKAIGFPVRKSDTAAYNWRNMASGSSRSHHSYGCVVDLNWNSNPMIGVTAGSYRPGKDPYSVTSRVVQIWKNHGFYWGGDWKTTKDYMHFTYTNH